MRHFSFGSLLVAALLFAPPMTSTARDTSVFSDPYPCSVLADRPCVYDRTFCSVFRDQPCQPEIDYPIGQGLRLTIASRAAGDADRPAGRRLDTIADVFAALRGCWVPPSLGQARAGTQMSVRLSFRRDGELIGAPRLTYVTP